MGRRLLAAQCVLDAADGVLHLAFYLVALALGFELGIAQYLASNFLHFALGLFSRALDAVFVHVSLHISPPQSTATRDPSSILEPPPNVINSMIPPSPPPPPGRARGMSRCEDAKNPPAALAG